MNSSDQDEKPTVEQVETPNPYFILEMLGEGSYGIIYKCFIRETRKIVAIKTSKNRHSNTLLHEAQMMGFLMSENLDKANIIKFHREMSLDDKLILEFELLDVTLKKFILAHTVPLFLSDIHDIVLQLAVAFRGLKRVGVIHTDLKLDNIMILDQRQRPVKIKLIDFGLAIFSRDAQIGKVIQPHQLRAPEIFLGLPFSEAIDIWSLGCVMVSMVFNVFVFHGSNEYESLRSIINLLGPPPKHLLDDGTRTQIFFKKNWNSWTLKTSTEYFYDAKQYYAVRQPGSERRTYNFKSMHNMRMLRLCVDDDPNEMKDCVDLLKKMLKWDPKERITPDGILSHPFITKTYASHSEREKKAKKTCCFSTFKKVFTCKDID